LRHEKPVLSETAIIAAEKSGAIIYPKNGKMQKCIGGLSGG